MKNKIKIVLLGTGYPRPHPDRSRPALAIFVDDQIYIIDAGPGAIPRLQEIFDTKLKKFSQKDIDKVFLTHLHSDHTLGLPDLIYTPWVMRRENPIKIFGPKGTLNMVKHIEQAYKEDVYIRIHGLEGGNKTGYKTIVKEFDSGIIYKDEKVKIKAFKVKHGIWKYAYGFTFLIGNRKIVISGDTIPHPNIVKEAKGADVLIHEVVSDTHYINNSKYWQEFHTSSTELAKIVNKTKPKKLILIHQIHHKISDKELVKEITDQYKGKVYYGRDLDVFSI